MADQKNTNATVINWMDISFAVRWQRIGQRIIIRSVHLYNDPDTRDLRYILKSEIADEIQAYLNFHHLNIEA